MRFETASASVRIAADGGGAYPRVVSLGVPDVDELALCALLATKVTGICGLSSLALAANGPIAKQVDVRSQGAAVQHGPVDRPFERAVGSVLNEQLVVDSAFDNEGATDTHNTF